MADTRGPFGWTLPDGAEGDIRSVPQWLQVSGVHVVKYPFWIDQNDMASLDAAAWLTERLKEAEIRCIGLLAAPPPAVQAVLDERDRRQPLAANLFRSASVWQPLLEPIMTRLTIRVQTWQLGTDGDHSFIGRPELPEVIRGINRDLQGYGQPIGLAISWPWLESLPGAVSSVAGAVNRSTDVPLTAGELDAALRQVQQEAVASGKGSETWLTLNPLPKDQYDRDTRINDLFQRMGTVRGYPVTGAFITDPRDSKCGVLRSDWRPDEMFLPWRTASLLLGDTVRVGSIRMEGPGENMVFANRRRTMLMMWSPEPTVEDVYLGDGVRQIDAWGRESIPERSMSDGRVMHRLRLDRIPVFLVDVDPVVVALRMSAKLESGRLDSLLGRRQQVKLLISNPTAGQISGSVSLDAPADWLVESPPKSFDLAPGGTGSLTYDVVLRNSARIGETNLDFDFQLRSQPGQRFVVRQSMMVGPDGLDVEVMTKAIGKRLVVQISFRNHSDEDQDYDCLLFPPGGGQYQRRQISVPAGALVRRDFLWDDADSLIGKSMFLRAAQQDGGRVLNQSIPVTP